jgi:lipoate-protein ligase A
MIGMQTHPVDLNVVCWSAPTVRENLAVDEWLARTMREHGQRILRFWWGGPPSMVMGYSERQEQVIDTMACQRLDVEILRRVTGGGTVLQTSGVLNYSLVMPDPGILDLARGFRYGADLLVAMLQRCGITGQPAGISDIVVGDRKISGNAQARRWHALLVQGTLLVNFDVELAESVLRHPMREPAYRRRRAHREFLVSLADLGVHYSPFALMTMGMDAARQAFGPGGIRERTNAWMMSLSPLRRTA